MDDSPSRILDIEMEANGIVAQTIGLELSGNQWSVPKMASRDANLVLG